MEAATRELPAGTMLDDKYRVDRLLAVGGMGAVYEGTHVRLRKRVAIKVLDPRLSTPPMVERFHREAITASQIGHEGIAQTTDIGTSQAGEPFLVMELLEGESLAMRLKSSGAMPVEVACELGCAILSPLAAAHQAGIVHRDLKPDNVFLVRQSRGEIVKLLDFGISRAQGLEAEFRLTTTGLVLGTPYYMSPEQARGDAQISTAADLYAFGVILYEMLIGQVPIHADNYNQLMYRVMTGDFVRPRERRADLAPELEQLILRTMALDPAHRPRSAGELEEALLAFCRPTFREHTIERISASVMPRNSPFQWSHANAAPPASGSEHTVLMGSSPPPTGTVHPTPLRSLASRLEGPTRATPGGAARRSRWVPVLIAIAVITGGAIGTAAVLRGGDDAEPTPPVATEPVAVTAPSAPTGPTAPATTPAEPVMADPPVISGAAPVTAPETITLRFDVNPTTAKITIDGVVVKDREHVVPTDDAEHVLRVTAPGHTPYEAKLRYNETQRISVPLARARPTRPRPPASPDRPRRPDRIDSESPYQ